MCHLPSIFGWKSDDYLPRNPAKKQTSKVKTQLNLAEVKSNKTVNLAPAKFSLNFSIQSKFREISNKQNSLIYLKNRELGGVIRIISVFNISSEENNRPVDMFVMVSDEVGVSRWRHQLQLRTQAAHDHPHLQDGDDQARDPQQSDWRLAAELVIQSVAEVGGVQHDQDRQ